MMEKTAKRVVMATMMILVAACAWIMATAVVPQKAYGVELTAGKMAATTLSTQSASTNPYPDVTIKKVGKSAWSAVKFVKAKGGYKGIIKGTYYKKTKNGLYKKVVGKFSPAKKITKREFILVLGNLYGSKKVPVSYADFKSANSVATGKWACAKMVSIAKKLGVKIKWNGTNVKLNRAAAASYISVFAHYDKAFMPK